VTQPLCPLLTSLLLLASGAVQPAGVPSAWQAVVEQYARLDQPEQRQWLRELLGRLDRANRVVLAPGEAADQRAGHAALLKQAAQGRTIPQSELLELLRQTDQREKAAIERLARRFRIRVYDTFRLRRDEYNRRRGAWDRAIASWEAAGSPFAEQPRLIDWLEVAIASSMPGSAAALPDVPESQGGKRKAESRAPVPRSALSFPQRGLHTAHEPAGGRMELSGPATPGRQAGTPEAEPPSAVPRRAVSPPQVASGPAAVDRRPGGSVPQPAELPLVFERSPPESIPPIRPASPDVGALVAGVGPRRAAGASPKLAGQAVANLLPPEQGPPLRSPAEGPPRLSATDELIAGASPATREGIRTFSRRPDQPTSRSAEKPKALPRKPAPAPSRAASAASHPSLQPPPATGRTHRVNLAELATRVAGNNLALRVLEAELDQDHPWDARRLGPLVDRLGILAMRRHDLAVFHELITPRERERVGSLDSPQAAIARLADRIVEARTHASGPHFIGSEAQRRAELDQLDELSRQLAEMASQK
jgi:hypothetical protein